jgi:hypothetical protein
MEATGIIAPLLVFALVPKCGLCVVAWVAALIGLKVELCGSTPSWNILMTELGRRAGLPAAATGAFAVLLVVALAIVSWKLLSRLAVHVL